MVRLPAATVTEVATWRFVLSLLSPTTAPPNGAAGESVTVHVLAAPGPMLLGLQIANVTFEVTDIAPALAAMLTGLAKTEAAEVVRLTLAFDALADSVNCAVAIGPLGTRLVFKPLARQVYLPELPAQLRLFEAAVSAGNALTLTVETPPPPDTRRSIPLPPRCFLPG